MYNYADIKSIHLEVTQNCQANCPMCDRNMNGKGINPHINLDELSLEDCKKILQELKDEWEGTVKLIFQPGEEKNPGGASLMIKEGVLENPKPTVHRLRWDTFLDPISGKDTWPIWV